MSSSSSSSSGSSTEWIKWITVTKNWPCPRTEAFQMEFEILDANGDPINMLGREMILSAFTPYNDVAVFTVESENIAVAGNDFNLVRLTLTAGQTNVSQSLRYNLWDTTDNKCLYSGYLNIVEASKNE